MAKKKKAPSSFKDKMGKAFGEMKAKRVKEKEKKAEHRADCDGGAKCSCGK